MKVKKLFLTAFISALFLTSNCYAASFPNAKKTFTQAVNGVTKLVASLFNQPYDEIEAIETLIGALGCTSQSYSDNLKNLLLDQVSGCKVTYSGADEIKVAAGRIAIPDASGNVRWRTNPTETTVNWANIDTGSQASSRLYYIYVRADSAATTFTIIFSINAAIPTGGTFYRLIGRFYNNASSNIEQVYGKYNLGFGIEEARSNDTTYEAITDGYVEFRSAGNQCEGFKDGSNPPTTSIGVAASSSTDNHQFFHVLKGNFWKVTGAEGVTWTSVGGY